MKILDETGAVVENPDLTLGYLTTSTEEITHPAVEGVEEQWHWETVTEYPNGGMDVQRVVDVLGVQAQEEWVEKVPIQRYIRYTAEELAAQAAAAKAASAKSSGGSKKKGSSSGKATSSGKTASTGSGGETMQDQYNQNTVDQYQMYLNAMKLQKQLQGQGAKAYGVLGSAVKSGAINDKWRGIILGNLGLGS